MPGYRPVTGHLSGTRRAVTYVALVHGAATDDPAVWAATLLARVVRRWSEREEYTVEITECPAECRLHPGRHRHLRLTRDGRTENVDLEAVYWGSLVRAGSWWTTLGRAFHIGGAVLLADFAAVWSSIFGRHAYRNAPAPGPILALGRLLTLLVRLLAAPLIVAAIFVMAGIGRFRLMVDDAYVWLTDDRERAEIVHTVTDAVIRARAERVVLAGHSQGGSVVLGARKRLLADGHLSAADRVTTFGSADPLLQTVRRLGIQEGLGRYWALLAALWVLSVIVAAAPAAALIALILLTGKAIAAVLAAAGALWRLAPDAAPAVAAHAFPSFADMFARIAPALAISLVPAAASVLIITAILQRTGLARRILAGPDHRPTIPGHDVLARDDPMAPLVRAIGDPQRLRQIPQTASILLDHEAYFRNAATSLPTLFDDVWQRAVGDEAGSASPDDATAGSDAGLLTARYRTGLRARRIAIFLGWVAAIAGAAVLGPPTGSSALVWVLLAAVSGGAVSARLALLWTWMERMDVAARTGPHVVARRVRRRRVRRSLVFTVLLFAASALSLGGAVETPDTPAGSHYALQPPALDLALFVLGAALLASAIGSLAGTLLARIAGITSLLAYSALWLVHGPAGWIAVGICAAGSAYAVAARRSAD
ncbi:hypothetical protein [Spelaeicoccus albus]|uniref:Uncharacterized protein n=1 Tax=Spelaeicoccus albus TaxID=1280376 RepID=A0A7Z0IIV3_9MICO|nr:hypothetical protein [Spelaeicoccus albus]NYI68854.1 hypothetical protein [Spelaeicoccus albus]